MGTPWWQSTRTPKQGFVLGGFWLFLAAVHPVITLGEPIGWSSVLAALATLLGVGYLTSALLLRRRRRSPADPG